MELSKRTLGILKLFASVNENLVFKSGTKQRTISTDEGVFVEAELDESFPKDFAICGLATFLRNLEAIENSSLSLGETAAVISAEGAKINFGYGATSLIKSPPNKSLDLSASKVSVKMTKDHLVRVMRFAEINSLPSIGLGCDGTKFYLSAGDKQNKDSVKAKIEIGDAPENSKAWEESFTYDRFSKLSQTDYEAKIVSGQFVAFVGDRLSFMVAVER